jgi:hypothetical protein
MAGHGLRARRTANPGRTALREVPPLHLLVAEAGIGRVDQDRLGRLPVPHLPPGIPGLARIAATVRSVHPPPVRRGFRAGSAADGHGTPASFSALVIRAAECPASRCEHPRHHRSRHRIRLQPVRPAAPRRVRFVRVRPPLVWASPDGARAGEIFRRGAGHDSAAGAAGRRLECPHPVARLAIA